MKTWLMTGAAAGIAVAAFFAGASHAETRMAPQTGYHAQGEMQAAVPIMVQDDRPSTDMLGFLDAQSKHHASLAWKQEQMRNNRAFLDWLGNIQDVREWQAKSDHVMEEAAHLRDDYAMLSAWVLKKAALRRDASAEQPAS